MNVIASFFAYRAAKKAIQNVIMFGMLALMLVIALIAAIVCGGAKEAYANDGSAPQISAQASHVEGEKVTIWPEGNPVYAEWHKGDSGQWWATFWTYNGTKVYSQETGAGCGWVFYCYDANGNWTQIMRYDTESTAEGQVGPQGIASHWRELNGNRWF